MKNRQNCCEHLDHVLRKLATHKDKVRETSTAMKTKYGMPIEVSNDYLTLRRNINEANDFELFIFIDTLEVKQLPEYFVKMEITKYSKSKYKVKKLKFPLKYNMIQVADDQWIGKITVKEIIDLRDAQVINYNENTQRTMQRIVSGGVEHYRIAVNQMAVAGIQEGYENNTYIPNTITFSLPEDADISYDEETHELIISKSEDFKFDILDGYHRFVAMSKEYNLNHDFNYNMELRIVQFPEYKAKQFIWQEDQKTKMKKMDSESLNQTAIPTKIITRLNLDPDFNLSGRISPNDGIINTGWLHLCINSLWVRSATIKKKDEVKLIKEVTEKLKDGINYLVEQDEMFLKYWDRRLVVAVVYACYKETPKESLLEEVREYRRLMQENPNIFMGHQRTVYNKSDFEKLDKLRGKED